MAAQTVFDRIDRFNRDREPNLLKLKYKAMQQDAFGFLRGTCHLFYEDLSKDLAETSWFNKAPRVWMCGDLHIENFGSYKSDRRCTYFDLNDFDEAVLAPCTWEIARFLTSVIVATQTVKSTEANSIELCDCFLTAYTQALVEGKPYWMGQDLAEGMVADLLARKSAYRRKDLLEERTVVVNGNRSIKLDGKRTLPVSAEQRAKVTAFIQDFAQQQSQPEFFKLLDMAQRIAGTGSLGIERYVLLVEGKGSPDRNYLLDLKEARSSCVQPYLKSLFNSPLKSLQPQWQNEAERIVALQQRIQAVATAFLHAVKIGDKSYVLREWQSTQSPTDHLKLEKWDSKLNEIEVLMRSIGQVVAWGQLRSSGRQGSSIADDLIDFAKKQKWQTEVLKYSIDYSQQVQKDWQKFREGKTK